MEKISERLDRAIQTIIARRAKTAASKCKTPGEKKRSKGQGLGLAKGEGEGPLRLKKLLQKKRQGKK